jgi:DNA-binding CsgD family transcriptional regulator
VAPTAEPGLYGRDEELSLLVAFLEAVPDLPGALVLEGEAGAGKTTLFEAGLAVARERSYRVIQARPAEAEARLSFAALRDLLDPVFDDLSDRLPPPQRRALAVALLRDGPGSVPERAGAVEAGFLTCLTELAADSPVLAAIDDVQWLDRPSRRVLEYAARRLAGTRLAFLVTARMDTDVHGPLGLDRALHESRLTRIRVGPLSLGALHALLLNRLDAPFPRPVLRRIHEASRGNPFFGLELARALLSRGRSLEPGEAIPVPDDVRGLVRHRLRALPRPTRFALLVAAALSEPTVGVVQAAGGGDLESANEAGIVVIDGDRVRFAHPLFASGIYLDAAAPRRREVHRRLARLVTSPEEQARHLALATVGPDETVALDLERTAGEAFDRGAVDAAVELAARACEATPASNREGLHRRRIAQAEYCMKSGETGRAREVADAALSVALPGASRAEALFYRGRSLMFGSDWRTARDILREALVEATAAPALQARIELAFAQLLTMSREEAREALDHSKTAASLAEAVGRDDILGEALSLQAKQEMLLGHAITEGLVERALALQPALTHLWVAQWPIDYLAAIREWTDDLSGARAAFEEVIRLAEERGDEASREWTLWRLAHVECLSGSWTTALRHLEDGYAMTVQSGRTENQSVYLATRALIEAHLGRVEASREAGLAALDLATRSGAAAARREVARALGFLELSLGRPAEAHGHLGPLVGETRGAGIREPGAMRFVVDEIEALIDLGQFVEAGELLAWLEERASQLDRPSALAGAHRCRGLLLAARGETDEALGALRRALAEHERVPMPFERGRTLLALGRVARRSKAKRVAREGLDQALAVFEGLGASIWAANARAELERIAGRPPSGGRLTPTERRVAELLVEGHSSKEVAAALFVTPKTVETYTFRAYAKLGVHSRAALARRLVEGSRDASAKL